MHLTVTQFFMSLLDKPVVLTLPQEDALKGILITASDGFFLLKSEDDQYVAINQNLVLMVSEYIEPKEDRDDSDLNNADGT